MEEILQRVLKNALEAYVIYIPNLSTIEAPQGDYYIWELDTENLLRDTNLIGVAHFLRKIYLSVISTFENETEKDEFINNMQGVINAIVTGGYK